MFNKIGVISLEKIQAKARGIGYKLGLLKSNKVTKTDPFSYEEIENIIEKRIAPTIEGPGTHYKIGSKGIEKEPEPFVKVEPGYRKVIL